MIAYMLLCLLLAAEPIFGADGNEKLTKKNDHHFDILIFTQHWPYTTCIDWEHRSNRNTCTKIKGEQWSVHGLWPTQFGKIAPGFCNSSWKFDYDSVATLRPELDVYWPDYEVRNTPYSLWTHEWEKHGTCAAQLDIMDTEEKYFQAGIELAKNIKLNEWFQENDIVPGHKYFKNQMYEAILQKTKFRPHIDCEFISGVQFIKEIKVCYSKSLEFVHCDNIVKYSKNHHKSTGSCHDDVPFYYPARMNPSYLNNLTSNHMTIGFIVFTAGLLAIMSLMVATFVKNYKRRYGYENI